MKRLLKNVKIGQEARRVLHPMDIIVSLIRHFSPYLRDTLRSKDDHTVVSEHLALKSHHRILIESDLLTRQTHVSVINLA